jgi:hypothetical protein
MAAGLQITVGPSVVKVTVDSVKYTLSAGSPGYVPLEHRQGAVDAAAVKGITLTASVI